MRFGNVLGSRGSFLHSLAAQVARHQHITVTHPDVTRYFMTIPEAAGLVIEAAVMADAGETYVSTWARRSALWTSSPDSSP